MIYIFEYDDALVLFHPQMHAYALGEQMFLYTFYYALLKLKIRLLRNAVFSIGVDDLDSYVNGATTMYSKGRKNVK